MDFMFDWEAEGDRFSFDDSDRFEEDSLCSWISEPESLCNNWRGWRRNGGQGNLVFSFNKDKDDSQVASLVELASQAVACHIPFEVVEHFYPPIPEELQLRIAFWSFPENEEDIRLYSCLANGSAEEFQKGDHMFKAKAVKEALQIGFHLSATVIPPQTVAQTKGSFNVAVMFDRRRITSCNCTCNTTSWCAHVVALCLFRIHLAPQVCLRAPVSESLSRLHRDQLQKFAQYLISELPQQILPTAQRLLDELLSSQRSAINTVYGAPDPTAGPSASEQTSWCLDESTLHENIKKTLIKFCVPSPIVFSDVNYLSSTAPPAAAEWQNLLRPLRGREPEGMWNLLSIVREMFKRNDANAVQLLEILTEEVLAIEQILIWWFSTKISASHTSNGVHNIRGGGGGGQNSSSSSSQHAASSLCDEIVALWRLCSLDPGISPMQRDDLQTQFKDWHMHSIDKVRKARGNQVNNAATKKADIEVFTGFKAAIEATQMDWMEYVIPCVTYIERHRPYSKYYTIGLSRSSHDAEGTRAKRTKITGQVSATQVSLVKDITNAHTRRRQISLRMNNAFAAISAPSKAPNPPPPPVDLASQDAAYSSSSEGFCESDARRDSLVKMDSDSDQESKSKSAPAKEISQSSAGGSTQSVDSQALDPDAALLMGAIAGKAARPEVNEVPAAPAAAAEEAADEYQVYFYDTKAVAVDLASDKKKKADEPNYFAGIRKIDNKQDILFARAEALHFHGHTREACKLALQLAEEMLSNPPDLSGSEPPQSQGKKKKSQNNISTFASSTLAKAAFLCTVLLEEHDCHHWAFRVGMFGLEMPRPPASSKALEVKLAYQESELVTLLKRIPPGRAEMDIILDRAEKLRDGKLKTRGDALLPLTLASFIFDTLCLPLTPIGGNPTGRGGAPVNMRPSADDKLGFEAAVAALGLKANISEADHPLLCEGTRRQRGELAVTMLVHYKDDQSKLAKIMDKLLDKEMHQLYRAPPVGAYSQPASKPSSSQQQQGFYMWASSANGTPQGSTASLVVVPPPVDLSMTPNQAVHRKTPSSGCESDDSASVRGGDTPCSSTSTLIGQSGTLSLLQDPAVLQHATGTSSSPCAAQSLGSDTWQVVAPNADPTAQSSRAQSLEYLNLEGRLANMNLNGGSSSARPKTSLLGRYNSKDTDSSALDEDPECAADYKAWEAKFRCTNLKSFKKPSVGMASVDSSAPETTSSDNSPTLIRRNWAKHHGPGSDSGSSGKSSDSLGSSVSGQANKTAKRDNESPTTPYESRFTPQMAMYSRNTPNIKAVRYKGKNRLMPTVPNQPSEASAHFMFELAKNVLNKAGGNSSTSLFTQPTSNNNPSGPHRALHLCAFQIGLYALGLHNCVSPNWLSRTYSSHVSWITGQAMEIGSAAINILIETWEGHLTPQEGASLADRASRGRDPNMVRAAAELALSCLPHAQALNPNEIQRALIQCKEQSREMLERACLAVERAAKGGGVYPEVLFDVARRWYELYEESVQGLQPAATTHVILAPMQPQEGQEEMPMVPVQLVAENSNSPPVLQLVPAASVSTAGAQMLQANQAAQPGQLPPGAVAMPPIPYTIAPPAGTLSQLPHHPYIAPYSYVQQVPPNFNLHYSAPHIQLHTHNMHPPYMATYPYQSQAAAAAAFGNLPPQLHSTTTLYHANVSHLRPPPPQTVPVAFAAAAANAQRQPLQMEAPPPQMVIVGNQQMVITQPPPPPQQAEQQENAAAQGDAAQIPPQNSVPWNFLLNAYRVGMLAMETLARRVHDDRPQTKYARNPPYGEDVKWLLQIAMKLGTNYLQQFCASAVNAIVSPFVLQDISLEAAHYLARSNPAQVSQQLRSPMLNSLLQKCLQMFIQCTHQRIHHISPAEYEEFVGIVCSARTAFCMTPGGMVQFHEMLQSLRRTKSCKRDLYQRILNGLHSSNV